MDDCYVNANYDRGFEICGYAGSYVIISIIGYRSTKKNVEDINQCLIGME